jgi:hypothetical protein
MGRRVSQVKKAYVVDMRHDSTGDPDFAVFTDYDEAVERAHEFFESYDFVVKNGEPFDPGNDRDVFDNVKMHNGKVAGFMHCGGDGPVCEIKRSE